MRQIAAILVMAWWSAYAGGPGRLAGQETAADASAAAQPPAAAGAETAPQVDPQRLREQTIYIPFERLKNVFEREGRGVFLPYERFQELWHAARAHTQTLLPPPRPVDAVITEIDSEATIADQVVNVQARVRIDVLGKGWVWIPLRLHTAAIRSARIGDAPARLVRDPEQGHRLLWHQEDDQPRQLELVLEYTRAFTKTPGQSSVEFDAPQAPINRWRVHVPEAGMSVQVEPMIATTRAPLDAAPAGAPADAGPGDVWAFVGAAPTVKISWNPRAEGAAGLEAFATVQAEQQLVISEGVARSSIKLDYEISRAALTQLVLEIPADQKITNVVDRNVQRWQFDTVEDKHTVRVDLFEATQGRQALQIELEQFRAATEDAYDVPVPLVRAVGAGRQQGIVVVRVEEGQRGETTRRSGLLQLDQTDLPETLRGAQWDFAYRYGTVPFDLAVRVEKVSPRLAVTELVEASLSAERLSLEWQARYTIQDAGVFQLRLDLPDGFEVRTIEGKALAETEAAAVDSYHRVSADANTWLVNLSRKALGSVGLRVQLERRLSDPNLMTPTGTASTLEIPLPRATAADVEFAQGALVIHARDNLSVNPAEDEGLRSISFAEALRAIPSALTEAPQFQPVLAYAFAKGTARVAVTAQRRRPQVTVTQLLRAEIAAGVVKFHVTFLYDIKYSGVKSLRVDLPSELAAELHNISKSLTKEEITPAPADIAEGQVAWKFAAETELLGTQEVDLAWERKLPELGIGKSVDVPLPRFVPREVDRATGQIVLSKSEAIDFQPTGQPTGLNPIDPQRDVLPAGRSDNAAMAFEFLGDWSLVIRATRYELETSKLTSIERGVVRIVALRQGELSIQALYRVRSARQRLAIGLPEAATFDAQPLRIDGQPVSPERESATTIFAPLADQQIDRPFVLELRYSLPGTPGQLDLPEFPEEPAVQKVYLCAYLPEQDVLVAHRGPWSDEQHPDVLALLSRRRYPHDAELIQWVTEGVAAAEQSAQQFAVGQAHLHVYSALRPQPAPDGSLQLRTMRRTVFQALVVLGVAVAGLPLFRRAVRWQLILLLAILAAVVLVGVFLPDLSHTLIGGVFPIALMLVVVIWLIGHASRLPLGRRRAGGSRLAAPNSPFEASASPPPEPSPPPPPASAPATADTDAAREGGPRDVQ
jgi:hypothetical protein